MFHEKRRVNHEINFHLWVFQETSIKNALLIVAHNRTFQTVKCTEDCLQQYITNRCWLIESGLGNTASISFPPPLLSFFLHAEWSTMASAAWHSWCLLRYSHSYSISFSNSPFSIYLFVIYYLFSVYYSSPYTRLHLCFSDILGSEEKTHICCPVPSQVVNKPVVFHVCVCVCVCVRFLFRLSQPRYI